MRLFLAPMEGVVDHHFRSIYSAIGGIDICVSEFLRVNDRPISTKTLLRDCPELRGLREAPNDRSATPTGTPVHVQLLGSNPQSLAASACNAATLGAAAIDLNFGCPARTVNNSQGGAILLKNTRLISDIVGAVRRAVPVKVPVTAKIRLGFEDRSCYMDNAVAIAEAGASELVVHARSRADGYRPPAYWSCIAEIVAALDIPVVANGEIWNLEDWRRCKSESNCEDFMLGRGLVACPDLALQIKAEVSGLAIVPFTWDRVVELLFGFYQATKGAYPKRFLGNRVKQWLFYLQMCYPEAQVFFQEVKRYRYPEQFAQAFSAQGVSLRC